jgi:dTDP-4-dehydrorhamnose reductase
MVIGATGMLGSMLVDVLSRNPELKVLASFRTEYGEWAPESVRWFSFHCQQFLPPSLQLEAGDWIVNAAGLIKHRISENRYRSVEDAVKANALLPYMLSDAAERTGAKLLQIATDCVFSGDQEGCFEPYFEGDVHDALDVYGKSKSLGEVGNPWTQNLRCSIVGPEWRGGLGLLEWFLSHLDGATVSGYTHHLWNGITTLAFAKLVEAVIVQDLGLPNVLHVVPAGQASKYDLLCLFREHFRRSDMKVQPRTPGKPVVRVLGTNELAKNETLWRAAGYEGAPTIEHMIRELAEFDCRFREWPK